MRLYKKKINRKFFGSKYAKKKIKDCANIFLNPNEQVSFITGDKKQYDFTKTDWGFYATPSINKRLKENKLSAYIVKNTYNSRIFVLVVENKKKKKFFKYLKDEKLKILPWPK